MPLPLGRPDALPQHTTWPSAGELDIIKQALECSTLPALILPAVGG